MPQERSIPAVRMTRVCPIATTPTTITCWRMSEKLEPLRNRSLCDAKKAQARNRATKGPRVATGGRRSRSLPRAGGAVATSGITARSLAPAVRGAELRVLAVHAGHRLVGDERDAGVGVAGRFLSGLRVLDARIHAHGGHLERVLLGGRGEVAGLHVLHAHAAAVHRDDEDALVLASRLECLVGARRRGLVDGVDHVDVGGLLQAVLHRGLPLRLIAAGVLAADDLRVALLDAIALEETVMAKLADGDAGGEDDRVSAERGKRRAEQGELQEHLRVHRGRLRWKAVGGASSDTTTFPSWRRRSPGASCCRHNDSAVHYPVGELGRKPRGSVWNLFASRKPDGHPWRQRRFAMAKSSAYAATAVRKPLG